MRIGDKDFEVILAPHGCRDFLSTSSGKASSWYQKIHLDLDDRLFDGVESDLWHEIIEMVNDACNFKFDHQVITVLGMTIHQVLRDNREFFNNFHKLVEEARK